MTNFIYNSAATRIVFGFGTVSAIGEEVERLGCTRPLLLSTPNQKADVERLAAVIDAAGIFSDATMHTPLDVTERALAHARQCNADCIVALGGGSTTGLSKALSIRTGLKQIVIPTTYAGSEVTPILGETVDGNKTTRRHPGIQPSVVVYDVDLTMSLPVQMSVTSGLNAMAHAVEALYAKDANPITSLMAEEGIAALARSLRVLIMQPSDAQARADALYGAWLCGTCLGSVGMALHHKICHVLGGTFDLPHAETHAVMLAHVVAFNSQAAPHAMERIARALKVDHAAPGLFHLSDELAAPQSLKELGMPESGIELAAQKVTKEPYWNPQPVDRDLALALIRNAFHGRRPAAHGVA